MSNSTSNPEGVFFFSEDVSFSLSEESNVGEWLLGAISDHKKLFGCINVVFCSDEYLLDMNKEYLHHDYYTDILTFPMSKVPLSGDLFISIDRVKEYSESNAVPFLSELNRVMIHGVLHLIGYGDKSEEEVAQMRAKENYYLNIICDL